MNKILKYCIGVLIGIVSLYFTFFIMSEIYTIFIPFYLPFWICVPSLLVLCSIIVFINIFIILLFWALVEEDK